jgi:hypothetical protein
MSSNTMEKRVFGRIVVPVGTYDAMSEENYLASLELYPDRVKITNHGFIAGSEKADEAIRTIEAGGVPDRPKLKLIGKPHEVSFADIAEVDFKPAGTGPLGHLKLKLRSRGLWGALTKKRPRIEFTAEEEPGFAAVAEEIRSRL